MVDEAREYTDEFRAKVREGSASATKVLPANDAFNMGCGNCQNHLFAIHIVPIVDTARIVEVACAKCGKALEVNDQAIVQGLSQLRF